jgi:hypothetical protein
MSSTNGSWERHTGTVIRFNRDGDDFRIGEPGSAGEPQDVETREQMDEVLALCSTYGLSWEDGKARYFRGLPARYSGYGQGPQAVAGKPGLRHTDGFHDHYPVAAHGSGHTRHTVSSGNDDDLPPQHHQTITKRLGIELTPAQPWVRAAFADELGDLWSIDQGKVDEAIRYAQRHGCSLDEAMGRLGVKAQRIGQHHDRQGHSPEDMHALTE